MDRKYVDYAVKTAFELLKIDSPTGYTNDAVSWLKGRFEELGYKAEITRKGSLIVDLSENADNENALLIEAHVDTLGAIVAEVKSNGRLRISPLGGLRANNIETENVRIHTRSGKIYDGTFQILDPSTHVNPGFSDIKRAFDSMEIVIDEDVRSASETRALGIENGDIVAFDPRARLTESGYIKSRYLDDKLSLGILISIAKYMKDENKAPARGTYLHITTYEEVGHGGASSVPNGVTDVLSIDMGCVGNGIECTEKQVSICAKDSVGPYCYDMVTELIEAAKKEGASYSIDVYPNYGSDVDVTLKAGADVRHGLIGPGVYASHGYERSHTEGVHNTLKLLKGYLDI